jgi:hypothetical protein
MTVMGDTIPYCAGATVHVSSHPQPEAGVPREYAYLTFFFRSAHCLGAYFVLSIAGNAAGTFLFCKLQFENLISLD